MRWMMMTRRCYDDRPCGEWWVSGGGWCCGSVSAGVVMQLRCGGGRLKAGRGGDTVSVSSHLAWSSHHYILFSIKKYFTFNNILTNAYLYLTLSWQGRYLKHFSRTEPDKQTHRNAELEKIVLIINVLMRWDLTTQRAERYPSSTFTICLSVVAGYWPTALTYPLYLKDHSYLTQ